ncbi:hypothetical protein Patl1_12428 [Pistacia atlantica]|uniref:Uncharacterized protein n=1 Tax=Pistacia atlantica TaxID=434234 RepID=A0ACC1A3Z4_9ROSI|nr:hypothetical protein Patl1_12428 [Pistacia atlantica]
MVERVAESFVWEEEYDGQLSPRITSVKRKVRTKKWQFLDWGSKPLIEFLQSIGKDTCEKISQFDVTDIVSKYVKENNLFDPRRKKRILCDEKLRCLFGRKSISRNKIYDMLEAHYAENHDESDDGILDSSEDENEKQKTRKTPRKKKHVETPKSCFAAIIPDNIKLVYLKRSLVQDLLKDPETCKHKIVGSFIRIKSDPNDYLQKNSHWLLQVTGLREVSRTDNTSTEILLQASNYIKDIHISTLSNENFSKEECEDLHQRVKDGLLKRPTVVELEKKARILHEDITKHYLERRQLLQTPAEQSRLLHEVPEVIADEIEQVVSAQDYPDSMKQGNDDSLVPLVRGASDVPIGEIAANGTFTSLTSLGTETAALNGATYHSQKVEIQVAVPESNQRTKKENQLDVSLQKQQNLSIETVKIDENKIGEGMMVKQVIDLSDNDGDEDDDRSVVGNEISDTGLERLEWHYVDPCGEIQGPFSITSLKRWSDADYFPPGFMVWKAGESQENTVLLSDILQWVFP